MEKESSLKIEIDKYINGELADEALANFEKRLKTDSALKANVNAHKEIHETLLASKAYKKQDAARSILMEELANEFILEEAPIKQPAKVIDLKADSNVAATKKVRKNTLVRWLMPAVTLAAAASLLFMFFPFGNTSLPTYANKNYDVYDANFTTRGAVDDLAKAGNFYEAENWAAALEIFAKHPNNNKAQMAKGNCEYQLKQYDNAIATFKRIANNNSEYSESAAWYLGLSYLQKEDENSAIIYFNKLSPKSKYSEQAEHLLNKLD